MRDWLSKRSAGWFNLRWLGRRYRFRHADQIVTALGEELRQRQPDHVIFSGDATALGFEAELVRAVALLGLFRPDPLPGLAVPGNHDYYTPAVAAGGAFERHFAAWQTGLRVDEATYPFAQRVGRVWLVAVNSSKGNRWVTDASGAVGQPQLERLAILLSRLDSGPRILVTHYPVCLSSGAPEMRHHGLRDLADLLAVAQKGGIGLWLHGHRHGAYYLEHSRWAPFPIVCAGSATQTGRWSYGDYTITGREFQGVYRVYSPEQSGFQDGARFEFHLPG
jgi:3',5'-cyclic AMP phosphodiesterase CpdA